MKPAETVIQVLLWCLVILTGIEIGARVYEARVIVPLWASAPPGTVRAYDAVRSAYASYMPDPWPRFWMYMSPALGGVSFALLLTSLAQRAPIRSLTVISSAIVLVLVASTYAFFTPALSRINDQTLSYDEVSRLVRLWVPLNWTRSVLLLLAWAAGVRALGQYSSRGTP
jgi:hypothetical protein